MNKIVYIVACLVIILLGLNGCASRQEKLILEMDEPKDSFIAEDTEVTKEVEESDEIKETRETIEIEEELPTVIVVHVCGAVQSPGVYELKGLSRVSDAIEAAGGLGDNAAANYLNQAAVIADGQQIYIPTEQELDELKVDFPISDAGDNRISSTDSANNMSTLVNINTASKEQLMTLPGIGEAKADSILTYRSEAGGFSRTEDIMQVEGIKEGLFQKIREYICTE